ncbi:MAG: tetratricopeptide repeat protein, partial [Promethearchaeota archaeon]
MERQELKKEREPEVLNQIEKFIDEEKLDEALTLLNAYEQKGGLNPLSRAFCHLYRCKILFWRGKYKELIKIAEQIYEESDELEDNLLKFDSFLLMLYALARTEKLDKAFDLIKQGEELLKQIPKKLPKVYQQREAFFAYIKGSLYIGRGDPNDTDKALEYMEHSLALRENLGIKHEIAESLAAIAGILSIYKGEINGALELVERSLSLVKESHRKHESANCYSSAAIVYSLKGDLDQSILYFEKSLKLYRLLGNQVKMAGVLNNLSDDYKKIGDLNHALDCIVQAIEINRDMGMLTELANNHDFLIQILIDKGDLEQAQMYLRSFEQLSSQIKDRLINVMYLLNKALLLKTSSRAIKRGKAEEILKQLIEDENFQIDDLHVRFRTLLNLCELLLTELRLTNDLKVLEELNHYI